MQSGYAMLEGRPYTLREQVIGFAMFVEDAAQEVLAMVEVQQPNAAMIDQLIFMAGVWRIWQTVNGPLRILQSATDLLSQQGVGVVQIGGSTYSRESAVYRMLISLRNDLLRLLQDQGLIELTRATTLRDVAHLVAEERNGR